MKTKKLAQKHGLDARSLRHGRRRHDACSPRRKNLMVFASTWGEGDPPSRAVDFYEALMGDGAPRLDKDVRFAVLALGDTAYAQFCAIGKAIDARLEALGATRAADRIDLDLDFAKQAAEWTEGALAKLAPADAGATATVVHVDFKGAGARRRRRAALHGREPARSRDRHAHQSQRHGLDARDLARGDRRRRAGLLPICRATRSASCPRTIPIWRWSSPRRWGSAPTAASSRSCARATT